MDNDKLAMHTPDIMEENFKKLSALFPSAVTETIGEDGKVRRTVDADVLRQLIDADVAEGREERYQFTWPEKAQSVLRACAPTRKTLRLDRSKSVGRDGTAGSIDSENIYIEGDNLEVLKILQETYLGKVKMIYIDPPYNTGNDFIYRDDFAEDEEEYWEESGQIDDEGGRLVQNMESNGRFHTNWLNMIYPRLWLARDLLAQDGVIFISIDDNEAHNLRKCCDDVFGAGNFVNMVSVKMKNVAGVSGGGEDKRLKKNIEFVLIYARNYNCLKAFENVYVYTPISKLVETYREEGISWKYTTALVDQGKKVYIGSAQDGDGSEIKIYKRVDYTIKSIAQIMKDKGITEKEAYDQFSHCIFQTAMPQSSIRPRVMQKVKDLGIEGDLFSIEYVPRSGRNKGHMYEQFYKGKNFRLFAWLKDVAEERNGVLCKKDLQGTYWDYVSEINNLTKEGDIPFPNGKKPLKLILQMLRMASAPDSLVLDFFSGSATTAHALLQLNAEDGGRRRFIMIQLPEECAAGSEARKAGFANICEIGEERIRRAGRKIKEEMAGKADGLDIGFRVFKVDSSNMKDVWYTPEETAQEGLGELVDNIKEDRTAEDLLFQAMLELGIELSADITEEEIAGHRVFFVRDGALAACFDDNIKEEALTEIAKRQPAFAVLRDSGLGDDSAYVNFEQIFKAYSPGTRRRVI